MIGPIPAPVALEFPFPKGDSGAWHGSSFSTMMAVPEATVDEYDLSTTVKNKIGTPGEFVHMEAVAGSR